jgi:VPDSG-CTERM motif
LFKAILVRPPAPVPTTVADGTTVSFGTDIFDNVAVMATFNDKTAAAEGHSVPDGASTAILLGIALIGIEGLRRRFRIA